MPQTVHTRLAPTPSGYLHEGNLYNFLLNWLWARSNGGRVLLRIDDGDADRKRTAYVEDIFRVLEWLELDWDTGPSGVDDFEKNWSQHRRRELYENILRYWAANGTVYACVCSRSRLQSGLFCACREKELSLQTASAAWRIQLPVQTYITLREKERGECRFPLTDAPASVVVRKKDGFPAYQLCSLADDAFFSITHIARGNDLLPSTLIQLYLDRLLEAPFFHRCHFWHHALIKSAEGEKLSKSAGARSESLLLHQNREVFLQNFCRWLGNGIPLITRLHELVAHPLFVEPAV